jgi:hypothetical protein
MTGRNAFRFCAGLAIALVLVTGCRREPPTDATAPETAATGTESREQAAARRQDAGQPAIAAGVAVNARPLAGQAEIGIRAQLGNPSACEDVQKGRRCRYAQGGTDVTYIDGMADWISVDDLRDAPFSAAALAQVGLPTNEDPIESTPQVIRWQNLAGFREVTLHAGPDGRAARIQMKMATL